MSEVAPDGARGSHLADSINISLLPELRGDASCLNSPAASSRHRFPSFRSGERTTRAQCIIDEGTAEKAASSRSTPKAPPSPRDDPLKV